jgi:hypothetical protein
VQLCALVRVSVKLKKEEPSVAPITTGVAVPTTDVPTVKFVLDEPEAIFAEIGTVAEPLLLDRLITVVLVAMLLRLTVQVEVAGGKTLDGLQIRPERTGDEG